MSRASKITFGATCLLAATTVTYVHFMQANEREALHEGPKKDAARLEKRTQMTEGMLRNKADHEEQLRLRQQFIKLQPMDETKDQKGS